MANLAVHIAPGLRLGAPIVCVCGKTVTVDGHHGLSCRHGSAGRHSRLNHVNEILCRTISTDTLTDDPYARETTSGQMVYITQVPWIGSPGATCPDSFTQS